MVSGLERFHINPMQTSIDTLTLCSLVLALTPFSLVSIGINSLQSNNSSQSSIDNNSMQSSININSVQSDISINPIHSTIAINSIVCIFHCMYVLTNLVRG